MCPNCFNWTLSTVPFDCGTGSESGYHDCGENVVCTTCGGKFGVEEIADIHVGELIEVAA